MPLSSNTPTPSIVVPAGEQTISFNSPGCIPVSNTIFALPYTACAANSYACFLGMPSATAPSAIASININTNAGELPLTAPTTSRIFSVTVSARPNERSSTSASSSSLSVTSLFGQTPVIPSPTNAGVFGMVRIIL